MLSAILVSCISVASPAESTVGVSARWASDPTTVGEAYEFVLELDVPDDLSVPVGRRMKHSPILQLDVPPSVELEGKHLSNYRELARNEFLEAPFERLVERGATTVKLTLKESPKPEDAIGLIVTAFFKSKASGAEFFYRRRLSLPLKAGATAVAADAKNSFWGVDAKQLKIGDKAPLFDLPLADGSGTLALSDYVGKKKIIITTYRASW